MIDAFSKFDGQDPEKGKGLFTFYREQAQFEEEMRRRKKQKIHVKLSKVLQTKHNQSNLQEEKSQVQHIQNSLNRLKQSKQLIKPQRQYKHNNEHKQKWYKISKQRLGNSVIIVNLKDNKIFQNPQNFWQIRKSAEQRNNLKKIQQMINPMNPLNNQHRYFLQNKQFPSSFGKLSLEKQIIKPQKNKDIKHQMSQIQGFTKSEKKRILKPSYFNSYNLENNDSKKCISAFSYQCLPQLSKNKPSYSQIILPKRYKSRKLQVALKSNNSQILKQIRQSIKEQILLQKIKQQASYLDVDSYCNSIININELRQHQSKFVAKMNTKKKRSIKNTKKC